MNIENEDELLKQLRERPDVRHASSFRITPLRLLAILLILMGSVVNTAVDLAMWLKALIT